MWPPRMAGVKIARARAATSLTPYLLKKHLPVHSPVSLCHTPAFYSSLEGTGIEKKVDGPLAGIKVLDLTRVLAGPSAAQLLGDLGAEVIKIEQTSRGDDTRYFKTEHENRHSLFDVDSGLSNYFVSCNRNKRSITLNLKEPHGVEVLKKLVVRSDVLIENFIVGKMDELGLGYETLRKLNRRLVYSSISGYGTTGPLAKAAGYDVIVAARCGLMSITGEPGRTPMKTGVAILDVITGLHAVIGILSSLYHRDRETGGDCAGQRIDTSLFESGLSVLFNIGSSFLNSQEDGQRWGTSHPSIVPYQAFEAQDDYMILGTTNNRQFDKLCDALSLPTLKLDPRFKTNDDRVKHRVELIAILTERLKSQPAHVWVEKLSQLGLPCSRVNTVKEAFEEPQARERGMIQELACDASSSGKMKVIGTPIKLSESAAQPRSTPPALGQHTNEILTEIGYSEAEQEKLRITGVI